jgi:hypothetical protein
MQKISNLFVKAQIRSCRVYLQVEICSLPVHCARQLGKESAVRNHLFQPPEYNTVSILKYRITVGAALCGCPI